MFGPGFQKPFSGRGPPQLSGVGRSFICRANARGNILTNSGFETGDFTGWTTFGGNNLIQSVGAHGGVDYYKVYGQFNNTSNYTGIYQDNPSVPGAAYTADGWAFSLSSDGGIHGQT